MYSLGHKGSRNERDQRREERVEEKRGVHRYARARANELERVERKGREEDAPVKMHVQVQLRYDCSFDGVPEMQLSVWRSLSKDISKGRFHLAPAKNLTSETNLSQFGFHWTTDAVNLSAVFSFFFWRCSCGGVDCLLRDRPTCAR